MKQVFFFCLSTLFASSLFSQSTTSFSTGFDTQAEQDAWSVYRKGDLSSYSWSYTNIGAYSAPSCVYHDYPVGGTNLTDDWFVSPAFSMNHGGEVDSIRHQFSGFGVPGAGDTVALYLLVGSPDPDLASEKIRLFDFRGTDYTGDGLWRTQAGISIPPTSGTCYLAIRYSTIVNWLSVRFDNIAFHSTQFAGIPETTTETIRLFPNPSNGNIQVLQAKEEPLKLEVYDLTGKKVWTSSKSDISYELPLETGTYICHILKNRQLLQREKLVISK